ncbi:MULTISPECIES: hypothetical protein [unclassified Polaribacter]|uniref:hypothetical protein n=1 Tax=unclassified Polaribacter TaxID=196858 RepID=UPI0011BFC44A|nr:MULTISPECIES: hypothetical protein [unclassified Polaribacter]TXD52056.1 hypothetical protein ES043_09425 [Polaribacter sp. IC063]TXD59778.1 hypothetical protein ES044_08915 [Polaribacter sp. IC066]
MKTTFLKTALLIFITTMFSCEDNTNTNDSTGKDSFSCYVNGKLYIPSAGTGIGGGDIRPFNWSFDEGSNSYINIQGGGEYTVFINIINPKKGINNLKEELKHSLDYGHTGMIVLNEIIYYNTKDNQNNGTITFTELTNTKAIGTFECTLYNDNGDELKVTNGKFNLSLDSRTN